MILNATLKFPVLLVRHYLLHEIVIYVTQRFSFVHGDSKSYFKSVLIATEVTNILLVHVEYIFTQEMNPPCVCKY